MARISTYPSDTNVIGQDKWIGSDANNDLITKNFTANAVAAYFNRSAIIDTGQSAWSFIPYSDTQPQPEKTFMKVDWLNNSININNLAGVLRISALTLGNTTPGAFIENEWVGNNILVHLPGAPSAYSIYNVESLVPDGDWYYLMTISFVSGESRTIQENDSVVMGYFAGANVITEITGTFPIIVTEGAEPNVSINASTLTNWNTAYNDSIVSAAVTGTATKTLTLNQQDGGTIQASWSDADTGLTSVGLSMPSAFTVTNSPLTSNGTIGVTGAGTTLQYVRGDGSLATFPTIAAEAQRLVTEVYNNSGATLTKGTVVYVNGGQGNLPTITKAIATGDATSAQTYGVVQTDITNMNNGYVVVIGSLQNLDTQAYTNGTQLYLSSTVAGAWTSVKQYAPAHLVYVGIVIRSHPTQGVVEIRIQNGFEMDELHNVAAQSPINNAILQYKTATALWTSVDGTTSNIAEGTNLYYLDSRVRAALSASAPLLYNNITGAFSISQAGTSTDGYLSSVDWNTFNNKQVAGNYITSLTGEATGTGPGATAVTLNNASVTGKVLTGVNITGGTVLATDTMLTAFGKLQNQINGLVGSTIYQGVWDASTNTPTLTSSVGTNGFYYIVNVAGNTNLNGITDWKIGDWAIFNGGVWQKVDNTESVTSVNGFTGAVSLTTDNIAQGTTNLYFSNSLARTAVSLTTTGSSGVATYNNTTGVFNIPNYGSALSGYLPLTGGTLTGALVINPANSATVGLDVASNTFTLRTDTSQPFNRQLTTTIGSGTLVKMQAAGYGAVYVTDLGFYTSSSSAVNTTPNLYLTGGDNRVGINTTTPAYTLDVVGTAGVSGALTANSFVKIGGTSVQFLMADGSVTIAPSLTGFVPYTGATTSVDLGNFDLSAARITATGGGGGGVVNIFKNGSRTVAGNGYISLFADNAAFGFLDWVSGNTRAAQFSLLSITNNTTVTLTIPNASGTIALTSNLSAYVPYTGATANVNLGNNDVTAGSFTGGTGSFATSGAGNAVAINHSSGSGIALNITKSGSGEGIYVNKSSGSGNAVTIIGTLNATTLVKSGGTSAQFLKADGSVDSSVYALDSAVVKLTGTQTITGLKNFNAGITANVSTGGTQGFYSTNTSASGASINLENDSVAGIGMIVNISTSADGILIGNDTSGRGIVISNSTLSGAGTGLFIDNYNNGVGIEVQSSSAQDAAYFAHSSGRALRIFSSGTGYGLIINNATSATSVPFTIQKQGADRIVFTDTGAGTFTSSVTASSFIRTGGTSSQFLMANGSVNSTVYLPLSGGTLTGALSGTSATLTSFTQASNFISDGSQFFSFSLKGRASDNFGAFGFYSNSGATRYGYIQSGSTNGGQVVLNGDGGGAVTLDNRGMNVTGAATFSSSVTADGNLTLTNNRSVILSNPGTAAGSLLFFNATSGTVRSGLGSFYNVADQGNLEFLAGGTTTRMILTSSGNVGIGTTAPATLLDVRSSSSATIRVGSVTHGGSGDEFGNLEFFWADPDASGVKAKIYAKNTGNVGPGGGGAADLLFATETPFGSLTERMRITAGGGVEINNTLAIGRTTESGVRLSITATTADFNGYAFIIRNSTPADLLAIRNDGLYITGTRAASPYNNTTGAGANMHVASDGILYRSTSSIKYKKNVLDYSKGLTEIMQMRAVTYEGKSKADKGKIFAGLIAEEIHDLGLTEFVQYAEDGTPDALAYQNMVSLLIKGMQELKAELDTLKNK